jgi:hypothetical protein
MQHDSVDRRLWLWVAAGLVLGLTASSWAQELPYGLGSWPEPGYGNHRAVVHVGEPVAAVWARVQWRRRDLQPEAKDVRLYDLTTGERVMNVARVAVNREFGDIVFQPVTAPGEYGVYYLPYNPGTSNFDDAGTYFRPEETADAEWLASAKPLATWQTLPQAQVLRIEARTEFDRMDPMEVIATAAENRQLLGAHPREAFLLFPEDRTRAIRMTDDLPYRWVATGPGEAFQGEARPGEYYCFQIGVWAARRALAGLTGEMSELRNTQGQTIGSEAMTCFNLEGNDWLGRPLHKQLSVPEGKVQALWFGVQVPQDAMGAYAGTVTIKPEGMAARTVQVNLDVAGEALADGGVGDLWRLARLKWLDSKLGLDDEVVPPFTPLEVAGSTVKCLLRQVRFGALGLPESIVSSGREILAGPMALLVQTADGLAEFEPTRSLRPKQAPATVEQVTKAAGSAGGMTTYSRMEADGCLMFTVRLQPKRDLRLSDVRLELPVRRDCAPYMMGLGKRGGFRPEAWRWKWDDARANNMVWLGDVDAGVQLQLRGPQDTWLPVAWTAADVPQSWSNGGQGGCDVSEAGDKVLVRAYTGGRTLRAGEELGLRFRLLVTPFKPIDPNHWNWRYGDVKGAGTVMHVHHGSPPNPYINYPFLTVPEFTRLVQEVKSLQTQRADLGELQYPAEGNFNPRRGSLHIWATINFDPKAGGPAMAEYNQNLLSVDYPNEDSLGFYWNVDDRGMRTYVRKGTPTLNQYPVIFGTNSSDWEQGQRHVISLSWGEELAVYVDGQRKHGVPFAGTLDTSLAGATIGLQGNGFIIDALKISDQPYAAEMPLEPVVDEHTLLLDTLDRWDGGERTRPEKSAKGQGGALSGVCKASAGQSGQQIEFAFTERPVPPKGVNIYYTVRELSNHVAEMWPLRSLGDEIFPTNAGAEMKVGDVVFGQSGGGYPWLREHLAGGYRPGWRQPLPWLQETDAAIETQGLSRWHNYYVEGLNWLMQNTGLDGLYLDGIGYDREIMKRVAKVMLRNDTRSRINYHSGDNWSPPWDQDRRVNQANASMEHFPYLSNLWFGELYDYNMPPDYWLIEMSGIPFGLTGEMLNYENGGNPYRGMVYGMSGRQHPSCTAMWAFWDEFGIQDAEWLGYWSPRCPVRTDSPDVLATVYRKPGKSLIALAHWPQARARMTATAAMAAAPTVDGKLSAGEWDGAAKLTGFTLHDSDALAPDQSEVYVTWDRERLYLGFRCAQSGGRPKAEARARDGEAWTDDAMEFFIQPDLNESLTYQFVGNSAGVFYDGRGVGGGAWNGQWVYEASVGEGAWEGELSLPLANLALMPGTTIGFNACRDQQTPTARSSCWSPVTGSFHSTASFGQLALAEQQVSTRQQGPAEGAGSARLQVHLQIDWRALGLDPARARLAAPSIASFQPAMEFGADETIPVEAGKGWLLVVE